MKRRNNLTFFFFFFLAEETNYKTSEISIQLLAHYYLIATRDDRVDRQMYATAVQ